MASSSCQTHRVPALSAVLRCRYFHAPAMASEPHDILIIGDGPAGLSAAASTVRQDHTVALFDSGAYSNAEARHLHIVPAWDHRDPTEFRAAALRDQVRYGNVTVERVEVEDVRQVGDEGVFKAAGGGGRMWRGRKVILATGIEDVFPDIAGYAECWVSGM